MPEEKKGIVKVVLEARAYFAAAELFEPLKEHLKKGGQMTIERDPFNNFILMYLFGVKYTEADIEKWDMPDAMITIE